MTELQSVMQFFNASEYESAFDETTQTWDFLAKCLEAYKDYLEALK